MSTRPVSRRLLLGTSALVVTCLTACDDVPLDQTRPGALEPRRSAAPGPDPDEDLLRAALLLEATQVARLERVSRLRLPQSAARRLREARDVHVAHVDLLRGDDPAPTVEPPSSPARGLLARLPATEVSIAEQHATACLGAQSGPFARVLASMAGSARQQAVLLAGLGGVP